ncbi:MAG: hypothetical protein U9R50_08515, partial [Campylobacterota bacterium]|nr:hypothetical protein [Campylobacterota bacterium]
TKYFTVRFVEEENGRYFIKYVGLRFDQELFYGYINGKRKWYIVNLTPPMQGDEILESNLH